MLFFVYAGCVSVCVRVEVQTRRRCGKGHGKKEKCTSYSLMTNIPSLFWGCLENILYCRRGTDQTQVANNSLSRTDLWPPERVETDSRDEQLNAVPA